MRAAFGTVTSNAGPLSWIVTGLLLILLAGT